MQTRRTRIRSAASGKTGSKPTALLCAALEYQDRGWSVIPIEPEGKKPLIEWKRCQTQRAAEDEIRTWFRQESNIAIVSGRVSGLVVLDIDPGKGGDASLAALGQLPDTLKVVTGGGGRHIYFAYPSGTEIPSSAGKLGPGLDVRGEGGYVVAPPSRHASGKLYRWLTAPDDADLAPVPRWLLELITQSSESGLCRQPSDERKIPEGERNTVLAGLAGSMRRRGASKEAIAQALLTENAKRCEPPLSREEIEKIAGSIAQYPPGTRSPVDERYTDLGNAKRLVAAHGLDLRYCHPWRRWLTWDGARWAEDTTGEVIRRAKATARALLEEASREEDQRKREALAAHATRSEARDRIFAMVKLAESEPGIPVPPTDLDHDPWLLNVANGTIDLITGELREPQRADLITKLAPIAYDPKAVCPTWLKFLDRILAGDQDLIQYLQLVVGYALTGSTREQCFFLLHGTGANGKSTFLGALNTLLGDYAANTPSETLLVKSGDGVRNDVARLKGARFVSAIESEDGRRLAEALIKQMTGGDVVTARFLYGEFFEYRPEFKIFLAVNHKPVIRNTDYAIWRRVHLIPFTVTIPPEERDQDLGDKLRSELPGILRWAVEGCLAWQARGVLPKPEAVERATASYRSEMDVFASFLTEACVLEEGTKTTAGDLYDAYTTWCEEAGVKYPLPKHTFGMRMQERGFQVKRGAHGLRYWRGIRIRDGE